MKLVRQLGLLLAGFACVLLGYILWADDFIIQVDSIGILVLYFLFAVGLLFWVKSRSKDLNAGEPWSAPDNELGYDESGKPKRPPEVISLSNRIFSILSHEIRTPVTAIASSAQVLKQGDEKLSDERRLIHFRNIQIAIDRIQGLIEGVTLVTQSEQGKLPFDPQPLDLKTFCQSTIEQLEAYRETNRIVLQFDDHLVNPLNLDENLLRHMLYNLLSNALKYSGEDAKVEFSVDLRGEFLELTVSDKGIGIPVNDHGHLFESFYRASNVSGVPGTGLGLNIAKRAVEAHLGTITYESKEGVGSAFMICLPLT